MTSCLPFSITPFQPINDLSVVNPHLIISGLELAKISSCSIYNNSNQCLGYCDLNNCYPNCSSVSNNMDCNYLLLIVNLYNYIQAQLNCTFTQTSIQNTSLTLSSQQIIITLVNKGAIENTTIQNNQSTSVKINIINLQENQGNIGTIISQCIQNVMQYATQNPNTFSDPLSKSMISSMNSQSKDSIDSASKTATSSVIKNISSASASIQNVTTTIQSEVININITNAQYKKALIDINQSDAISLLCQNVAVSTVNLIIPQLFPQLPTIVTKNVSNPFITSTKGISMIVVIIVIIIIIIIVIIVLLHFKSK